MIDWLPYMINTCIVRLVCFNGYYIDLIIILSLWAARCKKEPKTKNIVVYEFINVPFTATRQA